MPDTTPPRQKHSRIANSWKAIVAVIVVIVVVTTTIGLIYTQKWSKITVYLENPFVDAVNVWVFVDNVRIGRLNMSPSDGFVVVATCSVKPGDHVVVVYNDVWDFDASSDTWFRVPAITGPMWDLPPFREDYHVGPLSNTEVLYDLSDSRYFD